MDAAAVATFPSADLTVDRIADVRTSLSEQKIR